MSLKIFDGAIFIADAHENDTRKYFWDFLIQIDQGQLQTPQLFLMGDMFDLLVGKVKYTCDKYRDYIVLLEKIAQKIEVYYFEGNHDFQLRSLFQYVKVIPIEKQPVVFDMSNKKKLMLSHGDKYGSLLHTTYTKLIRSSNVLIFLNFLDGLIGNSIAKSIESRQKSKQLCKKIISFQKLIADKIYKYHFDADTFIAEGHYHQNKEFVIKGVKYLNFASFACNQSFFIVKCSDDIEFAQMNLRGQDV